MRNFIVGMVVTGVAVTCFLAGGALNERLMKPEIVEVPVEVEAVKWKDSRREFVYLEAEPVIEIVEVAVELRNFESTEELENWLSENHIDEAVMLYASGKRFDCDDYARRLIKDARADGFQLWLQVLLPDYRRPDTGERVTESDEAHALCSAIIGDRLYFIEPQTDDYWFVAKVD